MSDDNDKSEKDVDAAPDESAVDTTVEAEAAPEGATPSPRPRSAASRARRIGGAAVTPRPDADDAKAEAAADAPTVNIGKKAKTAKADASKAAPAKPAEKAGGRLASKAGGKVAVKPAKATDKNKPEKSAAAALTLSVPGWVRWAPGFAFAAVAVVFLTLFAVAQLGGDDAPDSTSSSTRQEVLAAAKTCLATLNTYRYNTLDAAEAAGVKCTTGKLTSDFRKTVETVIRKNAPSLKAVQIAKINTAGIEAVTQNGKQWTILAYGQLNISTANTGKQGRVDPFAVVARLQQVKGKWVLSKIDTVSSSTP